MSAEISCITQYIKRNHREKVKKLLRRLVYTLYRHGDEDICYYKIMSDGNLELQSNYIRRFIEDELGELLSEDFCGSDIFYPLKSLYSYSCTTQMQKTIFFAEHSAINKIKIGYIEKDNAKINELISHYGVCKYIFALLHLIKASDLFLIEDNGTFKENQKQLFLEHLNYFLVLMNGDYNPSDTSVVIELCNKVLE